jgi:hypothetical protein
MKADFFFFLGAQATRTRDPHYYYDHQTTLDLGCLPAQAQA